jgi:cbb3-type cytochrome oxidase subunit 3
MYPFFLGYMAIVYAKERRRARASSRAAELRAMRDAEAEADKAPREDRE